MAVVSTGGKPSTAAASRSSGSGTISAERSPI